MPATTKYLHIIEYRPVSGVFQNIDLAPPLRPASVSSPPHQRRGGGGYPFAGRGEGGGVHILEDARQYSVLFICKYFEDAIMELTVSKQIQS